MSHPHTCRPSDTETLHRGDGVVRERQRRAPVRARALRSAPVPDETEVAVTQRMIDPSTIGLRWVCSLRRRAE